MPTGQPCHKLDVNTVRVRWLSVVAGDDAAILRWRALLDDAERERADRFRFAADRAAYIAAHGLTRTLLSEVGGLAPQAWRFVAGPHGKPEIDPALGRAGLRFNLSHTRGFVAAAVGLDDDLGLDVEALDRRRPTDLAIADRFFAPAEVAIVRAACEAEALDTFFRFWTLKEAFIKATGEGLARALDSFAFSLDDSIAVAFDPPNADNPGLWRFAQFRPTTRHLLAVARRGPTPRRLVLDAGATNDKGCVGPGTVT